MGRKAKIPTDEFTAFELQIMVVIWRLRSASVKDVLEQLSKQQDFAYTTISTMMRVLEKKGILESVKNGASHLYVPIIEQEAYEATALKKLIRELFYEQPTRVVERLIKDDFLNAADLAEIKLLIEQKNQSKESP